MLFGFFVAMAVTRRANIRESTLGDSTPLPAKGEHGGRLPGHYHPVWPDHSLTHRQDPVGLRELIDRFP